MFVSIVSSGLLPTFETNSGEQNKHRCVSEKTAHHFDHVTYSIRFGRSPAADTPSPGWKYE